MLPNSSISNTCMLNTAKKPITYLKLAVGLFQKCNLLVVLALLGRMHLSVSSLRLLGRHLHIGQHMLHCFFFSLYDLAVRGKTYTKHICLLTSREATLSCNASFPSWACNAFRNPKATELQYSVSYASIDMAISSRMRIRSRPRSVQLMVTCRIISSVGKKEGIRM